MELLLFVLPREKTNSTDTGVMRTMAALVHDLTCENSGLPGRCRGVLQDTVCTEYIHFIQQSLYSIYVYSGDL